MEKLLCELGSENTEKNCSYYPVKLENTITHTCVEDLRKNNTCMEQYFCQSVPRITEEYNCSDYPLSFENRSTHICINDVKNNISPRK